MSQVPKLVTYTIRNTANDNRREMNHMSLRYSFFAVVPDGIIEIPQESNLSWLMLFYAQTRELAGKFPSVLSWP